MKERSRGENLSRPVYLTGQGDLRKAKPSLPVAPEKSVSGGQVRVALDTKGRRGKTVTVVAGIRHCPQVIEDLAKALKSICGAGGTLEAGDILIQGDHRIRVAGYLEERGFKVKVV
jgi:translation initiation factor 1